MSDDCGNYFSDNNNTGTVNSASSHGFLLEPLHVDFDVGNESITEHLQEK